MKGTFFWNSKKSYENVKRVLYRGKERVKLNKYA